MDYGCDELFTMDYGHVGQRTRWAVTYGRDGLWDMGTVDCMGYGRRWTLSELRASSVQWRQLAGAASGTATGLLRRLDGLRRHAYGHRRFVSNPIDAVSGIYCQVIDGI